MFWQRSRAGVANGGGDGRAGVSSTEVSLETEGSTHHGAHFLRMKMLNWWGENQTCKNKEAPTLKPVSEGAKTTEV